MCQGGYVFIIDYSLLGAHNNNLQLTLTMIKLNCVGLHVSTSVYRGQLGRGPSSASGPSLTLARLHGTHCRAISAKQSILVVLGSC